MTNVWCVLAEFGSHTEQLVLGGCVTIGWMLDVDSSALGSRGELYPHYKGPEPEGGGNIGMGDDLGLKPKLVRA